MRVLCFFDLPVKTKNERRQATKFRDFLIKDGFYMIQFSLYGRICNTIESAKMHEERIACNLPNKGSVRTLMVTEKQYASMRILVGKTKKKEHSLKTEQISFF
ncbi:MAG: CRISPR-associated endonuclease Cas2 [Christensenellales bacterium]